MIWRRWVIAIVAILAFGITMRAGFWQLDRAQQKQAAQASLAAQADRSPLGNAELRQRIPALKPGAGRELDDDLLDLRDRPVHVTGRWLKAHTVYLDNRSMDGRAGFFVATPLVLARPGWPDAKPDAVGDWTQTADVIWVQRGWAPRHQQQRDRLPAVATPDGLVQVNGRLAAQLSQRYALGAEAAGPIRQNLAPAQMLAPFQQPVLSMVVVQTDAPSDGLLRNWPPPDLGADKNRGYAVQWFGMAALILVLYVWLQILRPIFRRRLA